MEGTMNHLQLVRHLASRLGVLCRAYGGRMKRAEIHFSRWMHSCLDEAGREVYFREYQKQADKAARLHAWHSKLAKRAVGISRG